MSAPTIITNETRELVLGIEEAALHDTERADAFTRQLVGHLAAQCAEPAIQQKYAAYGSKLDGFGQYPIAQDNFAESFDPLQEEAAFYEQWQRYGVVVGKNVVPQKLCFNAVARIKEIVRDLSQGECNIDVLATYGNLPVDANGTPILTRGFFEIYHDDSLAQLRQSLRTYLHHVVLWGRADVWTTYDRFGVKLPGHQESIALPLHVDQNPKEHPDFRTVQGVLALEDCPVERGTLRVVPGSKAYFSEYLPMAPSRGEYVELNTSFDIADKFAEHVRPIPLRQGDLVSWDSRTTHANTANVSRIPRFVALIAAGPARQKNEALLQARQDAFDSGLGSNVREALMHASKRPRYTNQDAVLSVRKPEQLSLLGKLLYGQEPYEF